MAAKKVILIIMDGWGLGMVKSSDAIQNSRTPFVSSLYLKYPNTTLTTCGEQVGLPQGQMGNSEVGHLNLGAGRIVYQELQRINVAIREGAFKNNKILLRAIGHAQSQNKPLHLLGLVSNGGVHSHINHLKAMLDACKENGLEKVFVHAFTDGRDCDPKSGYGFLKELQNHMDSSVGSIASVTGRYYAMDRDNRWERVKLAYDALVNSKGEVSADPLQYLKDCYAKNITDEFIQPAVMLGGDKKPKASIKDGDVVVCFNFRTDRCREITKALTQVELPQYAMHPLQLDYTTMTEYDASFKNVHIMFENDNLNNTLGEVIQNNNLKQLRMAETEKYPHVTFFFSGGREQPFEGESRLMVASPKVATYDLKPEMSAFELTDQLLPQIEKGEASFICLNYANADMVGHTGVWEAVIKAVETVDQCVGKVITKGLASGYTIFLTADHGNADYMINEDGTPNTAHTLNLVPLFIIDKEWKGGIQKGKLGDIAPTILNMMNLDIPSEMTGNILI
ncbi:MAG: 2,3-bisphosphoglycerate-independent phosphoglycerate mutase [Flavisolibacter sp.]